MPKDLLYGELSGGSRSRGRPRLRYTDTCKRDMKSAYINVDTWENQADARDSWRDAVWRGTRQAECDRLDSLKMKRASRQWSSTGPATIYTCQLCGKESLPHRSYQPYAEVPRTKMTHLVQPSSFETEGGRRRRFDWLIVVFLTQKRTKASSYKPTKKPTQKGALSQSRMFSLAYGPRRATVP